MDKEMNQEMDEAIITYCNMPHMYTYSRLGIAIKTCSWSVLKDQSDLILNKLSCEIKDHVSSFQLSGTISCVEVLLRRVVNEKGGTALSSGLNKLIKSLMGHHVSSITCQCLAIHCLYLVSCLFPGSCKEYRSLLMKWCKDGLFSDNSSLVKESASLLQSLTYTKPSNNDDISFLSSIINSLQYCMDVLTLKPIQEDMSSLLYLPDNLSSFKGKEKDDLLVKCVGGLVRLVQTCLLVDTGRPLRVSLHDLWSVIWRLMEEGSKEEFDILPSHYKLILFRISWQLLLATIHSCGRSLLSYSYSIEAAIIKALQQTPPTFITSLICKCIIEWVCLRGIAPPQFIEDSIISLCLVIHAHLESTSDYKLKEIVSTGVDEILYQYIQTLYTLCTNVSHSLPSTLVKFIDVLCQQIVKSSSSVDVSHLSHCIVNALMEYPHINDIKQMDDDIITIQQAPLPLAPSLNRSTSINTSKPTTTSTTTTIDSILVHEETSQSEGDVIVTQVEHHQTLNVFEKGSAQKRKRTSLETQDKITSNKKPNSTFNNNNNTKSLEPNIDVEYTFSGSSEEEKDDDSELDIDALLLESFNA